jgi:hypothetical protein
MKINPLPCLLILTMISVSLWFRATVIEHNELGFFCDGGGQTLVCKIRWLVIQSFNHFGLGYFGLFLGVVAVVTRSAFISMSAACVGVAGLVFYNWEFASVGCLLGVLTLARVQFDDYRAEYRDTQQQT